MRLNSLCLAFVLLGRLYSAPEIHANNLEAWMNTFEGTFSASCEVGGVSFMYPRQFELSETTTGVFLEAQDVSGQISAGSARLGNKDAATELMTKQGGKAVGESVVNGRTVFSSTSIQGEQTCRTYIVVLKNSNDESLYIQFRWRTESPVDYTPMLDRLIATMK